MEVQQDPVELARFKREAHMAASLSHPNIGAIHEIGQVDGRHYLAMQYVPGRTLEKFPKQDRRLMARLIRDAARAVDHAHRNGVIHRDIKPGNLMVEEAGDGIRVVVLDFGIARAIDGSERLSLSGDVVGTPAYMSPEQARGAELDERADVYSLGATLYEILTGRPPFDGASVYDILKKVEEEEPPAPRRIYPNIAHDLETIVLKCLEKEPVRRYDSAKELAADLDRFLEGDAILAKRANTIYRLRMKLAKRKSVVGTAGIAAALLMGLLGWWIFVGRPHSQYLGFLAEGRKLWEEARVAAITGVSPAEIRKKAGAARENFEGAIQARPDAVGYLMKGRCLALEGDENGAQRAYEQALELDAGNAEARVELAKSLLLKYVASRGHPWLGSVSGSSAQYFGALDSERSEERHLRERAEALLKQGETAPTQRELLNSLIAMGKPDHASAAKGLAAYTKKERWDAQALMLEAMCRYYLREIEDAIAALDRSLILVPRSEGYRWRGLIKEAKGLYDEALVLQAPLILQHATITITEVLLGIALGTLLGGLTALQLMMSPMAMRLVLPVLVFSQAVPVFALAPLLTLWLGYGLGSKIAMAVLIIYFPVASAFLDGLRHTEPNLLEMGRSFGATPRQLLLRVRVPAALPVHKPADHAADENRRRCRDGKVYPHRKRQRRNA